MGGTTLLLFALQLWGASWVVRKMGFYSWHGPSKPVSDFLYHRGLHGFLNELITAAISGMVSVLMILITITFAVSVLFLTSYLVKYLFGVLI